MIKKILVPLDGSAMSQQLLSDVAALAASLQAELVLMRVAGHPNTVYYAQNTAILGMQSDDSPDHCRQYLQTMSEPLIARGLTVHSVVKEGDAADAILTYSDYGHVDLIAMSTHGRSGLTRWLLGSVADRVVSHSRAPVMLFRPAKPAAEA
jgi:nucleotide-binding universal stress UspA family protein